MLFSSSTGFFLFVAAFWIADISRKMTATINQQGHLVLETNSREDIRLREGDILTVKRDKLGLFVLQKRPSKKAAKAFLNPARLSPSVLRRIYSQSDSGWDAVECEAVDLGRKALTGARPDEL
jgi:bifunctional DNA-binding transcriptional regulator/antitoxin component of YhaV-PrlF toxin-antitoxin module